MTDRRETAASIGLLILRLGAGGYMLTHGVGKLRMLMAGQFEMMGDPIGIGPVPSLVLVTVAEFLCAILVMAGLATRPAAAVLVISMGVAAFVAHGADPWTAEKGYMLFMSKAAESWASKEPALVYLICFLALVFTGAGKYSLDAVVRGRRRSRAASGPGS